LVGRPLGPAAVAGNAAVITAIKRPSMSSLLRSARLRPRERAWRRRWAYERTADRLQAPDDLRGFLIEWRRRGVGEASPLH